MVTVASATGPEYDAGDRWAVVSKRFLRWAETWIEENIPPGANPDIESHEARAERLTEKLYAEAARPASHFCKVCRLSGNPAVIPKLRFR